MLDQFSLAVISTAYTLYDRQPRDPDPRPPPPVVGSKSHFSLRWDVRGGWGNSSMLRTEGELQPGRETVRVLTLESALARPRDPGAAVVRSL